MSNKIKGASLHLTAKGHQLLLAKNKKWTEQWNWDYESSNTFRALSSLFDTIFNNFCAHIALVGTILFSAGGLNPACFTNEEVKEFVDLIKLIFDDLDYDWVTNDSPTDWASTVKEYEEMAKFRLKMFAKYRPIAISWVGAGCSIEEVKTNLQTWDLFTEEDKTLIIKAFEIEDEYCKTTVN